MSELLFKDPGNIISTNIQRLRFAIIIMPPSVSHCQSHLHVTSDPKSEIRYNYDQNQPYLVRPKLHPLNACYLEIPLHIQKLTLFLVRPKLHPLNLETPMHIQKILFSETYAASTDLETPLHIQKSQGFQHLEKITHLSFLHQPTLLQAQDTGSGYYSILGS